MVGRAIAMVTSSTKFARYSGMRFVKHFIVSSSFYLLGEHAHLKTLSLKISNILLSILNVSLDIFDSLVQVMPRTNLPVFHSISRASHRRLIYFIHISGEEINDNDLVEILASREAGAPIYSKLGFSYGKTVRFKKRIRKQTEKPQQRTPFFSRDGVKTNNGGNVHLHSRDEATLLVKVSYVTLTEH